MLIHDKFYCEGDHNYYKFYDITEKLTKRQNVGFAFYCAKDVFHLVEDRYKESVKLCIDLIEKWLIDENSVTSEELRSAAYAADVSAAAHAAYAASVVDAAAAAAAAAADATWAASYTAHAANAAADSSWAAARAARAAYYAAAHAVTTNSNKLNEYLIIANSYFTKTNINCLNYEIEGKILYLIDELEENIIVHKDKYYVNMNEIELCPEYGFDIQQELLEKLLYSKCLFWEFVRNWLDQLYKEGTQC